MVFVITRKGDPAPCAIPTSKRSAVSLVLQAMLKDGTVDIDNMMSVKKQLTEKGKTEGFATDYVISEKQTNKLF